ncbi:MAG TPA: hypothetical protein VGB63_03695 [Pedobacter sp.]|jgi:uncharacterized membrane protein
MAAFLALPLLYAMVYLVNKFLFKSHLSFSQIGLIPVSLLLTIAGVAHFFFTKTMIAMMPDIVPFKSELVYLTGIIEIMAAIGLLIKRYRMLTGILLLVFLIAVLPANIVGAMKRLPAGGMEKGEAYLYFRIPLQFFFLAWVYYFAILKTKKAKCNDSSGYRKT